MEDKTQNHEQRKKKSTQHFLLEELPFFLPSVMGNGRKLLKERQGEKAQTER